MLSGEKINKLYSFYARVSSYLKCLESLLSKSEDIFENDFCDELQHIICKDAISTKKIYSPLFEVLASEIHQNEVD
ncbi:hypothetical protein BpHYR1_018811 [Brachionus plicatilis]|uniref:Uncharacterized protein n=1 Tax=Brachionus plicatilis TaxID=10195 RepID=A0A3M7SVR3_BRAPC|nr:hypothetical protein BpHYR1_018811 [Brachionus plicatilis]